MSICSYLLLHDHPSYGGLDHVGAIQAVHAVNAEDAFLLTDHPSLINPFQKQHGISSQHETPKEVSQKANVLYTINSNISYQLA